MALVRVSMFIVHNILILILDIHDFMKNIIWACVAIYFQRQKSLFIFLGRSLVVTGTEAHFCSTCARVGPKRYHCLPLSPRVTPWKIETSPVSPPPTPNGKEGKFNCYICSPADLRRPDPSLFFLGGISGRERMKYKMQAGANKNQTLIWLSQARWADRVDWYFSWLLALMADGLSVWWWWYTCERV